MHMGCVLLNYVLEHVKADSSYRELTMKDPDSVHTHWLKLSVWGGGPRVFVLLLRLFRVGCLSVWRPKTKRSEKPRQQSKLNNLIKTLEGPNRFARPKQLD